jgi:tetratricopeptide (TPR) repeat protein
MTTFASPAVAIALFGWIPIVVILFAFLPPRRAMVVALVTGWLSLPPSVIGIPGLPDLSKNTATSVGMLTGTWFFAPYRLTAFRPRWFDIPVVGLCLWCIASSVHNDLGWYDGFSSMLGNIIYWGLPYLLGRCYFDDLEGLRELAMGIIIGGLVFALPCHFETKMSPMLLEYLYGVKPRFLSYEMRWGGYRPQVFFWTGLECGMWMTGVALTAWWLWWSGTYKRFALIPSGLIALFLVLTAILCRSITSILLLFAGLGLLWASTGFIKTRLLLVALVLFGPCYAMIRVPNLWSGDEAVKTAKTLIGAKRAESLQARLHTEDLYIARALKEPVYGWGGWGRHLVYKEGMEGDPKGMVGVDGMWISFIGSKGLVGLALWYLIMELPVMVFLWRFPARLWRHPRVAPAAVGATLLGLYMIDCILNGFINEIYVVLGGGLVSICPTRRQKEFLEQSAPGVASKLNRRQRPANAIAGATDPAPALNRSGGGPRSWGSGAAASRFHLADRYRSMGRISRSNGRLAEARTAWQHALDLLSELVASHPDDPIVQQRWCDCANDLAWLLINHPDSVAPDPAAALVLASQAVKRRPDCGVYWNTLGAAYCRAGDFQSAVAALDRATALRGGNPAFDEAYLALAHARLGHEEHARHHLDQAMHWIGQHHPDHPELLRACAEARAWLPSSGEPSMAVASGTAASENDQQPDGSSSA